MRHPKEIGDQSTMAILYVYRLQGWDIFVPFGENSRADFVVDRGHGLQRVQCKTGRLREGSIVFNTCSSYGHHPHPKVLKRDYIGEIDEFAVFCPPLGSVLALPIDEILNRTTCALRVDPPRNNQKRGIRLAAAYEVARIDVY